MISVFGNTLQSQLRVDPPSQKDRILPSNPRGGGKEVELQNNVITRCLRTYLHYLAREPLDHCQDIPMV